MNNAYIVKVEKFLPNKPISNDEMESFLGTINCNESKSRRLILRNNGIKKRYYALDSDGNITHSNAQLAAVAVRKLFDDKTKLENIDLLTSGTSSPDVIQPSHALMVHGELGGDHNLETLTAQELVMQGCFHLSMHICRCCLVKQKKP